jgi:O-antigen ligase
MCFAAQRDRMMSVAIVSNVLKVASWSYRLRLTEIACIALVGLIFFSQRDAAARFVFVALVVPLAALGLLSPARFRLRFSTIMVAWALYLLAMLMASFLDASAVGQALWVQSELSVYTFLFMLIIGGLVAAYDDFTDRFFFLAGGLVASSALVNIILFFDSRMLEGYPIVHLMDYGRLMTSIGMPAYANSTNIGTTYGVFAIGTLATAIRGRLGSVPRLCLLTATCILLVAVLLTQARGAILGVLVGVAVLVLTKKPKLFVWGAGAVAALIVLLLLGSRFQQLFLERGLSSRPEVWEKFWGLITERPWTGYGSFNPIGIVLDNGNFLDQAHNLVLSAWFRGGAASALAMAYILLGGIYWARRYWLTTRNAVPLCVMVTVAAAGMVDYQLLITSPTWPWVTFLLPFGLCVGAEMAARRRSERPDGREGTSLDKVAAERHGPS